MMSFFDDPPGKASGSSAPMVSKVVVRKPAGKPLLGSTSGRPSTSSPAPKSNGHSAASASLQPAPKSSNSSSSLRPPPSEFRSSSSPAPSASKGSSSKPVKTSSSAPRSRELDSKSPLPSHANGQGNGRKRRTPSPVRSESDSGSSSSEDALNPKPKSKPTSKAKRAKLRDGSELGGVAPTLDRSVGRAVWCLDKVDERGEWGRGWAGFVRCEEVVRGVIGGWAGGGAGEGRASVKKYHAYFPQPGFENAEPLPSVELLYPAGCREKFILLNPNTPREYSPIFELRNAVRIILDHYVPPSHSHIFGILSTTSDLDLAPSRIQSPNPATFSTPPPENIGAISHASPLSAVAIPSESIADAIRKALAPNRRDGPGLVRAIERLNTAFAEILEDGSVARNLHDKGNGKGMDRAEWSELVDLVHDQAYSRVVGPYSQELEHHPKHPDEVARAISAKEDSYGELRHRFMRQVIEQTGLGPHHTFVDLGSGVGNCVVQAALQAGCRSFGIELLPVPAHCARLQLREVQRRWAMWGLAGNSDVEFAQGDFRTDSAVAERLREADVVLVNNEVFPPNLNVDLTNMFLDLKEGATIVSLKPFVPETFKMNESNCDSFAAIVRLTQQTYHKDWVSWKGDSGKYYVQVIDRSMRRMFEEELMGGRRRR